MVPAGSDTQRARRSASALCLLLVLTACTESKSPAGDGSKSPGTSASADQSCGRVVNKSPVGGRSPRSGASAVYSYGRGLWLYDVALDSLSLLKKGSGSPNGLHARFRGAQTVSFADTRVAPDGEHPFGRDSISEITLPSHNVMELLQLPNALRGYDWSPDTRFLAYQVLAGSSLAICFFDAESGSLKLIRGRGLVVGTSAKQSDEESVAWSPDGKSILIADTLQSKGLFLLDPTGKDLMKPWAGTFPRWLPNGRDFIFREIDAIGAAPRWFVVNSMSGARRRLSLPGHAFRPALSPDGTAIAYDNGDERKPSVSLYDLARGTSNRLITGYAAPIWLGADALAATAAGPCPPATECSGWWQPLGRTIGFNERGKHVHRLALKTTIPAARLDSRVDVLL